MQEEIESGKPLFGTYPPSPEAKEKFAKWRKEKGGSAPLPSRPFALAKVANGGGGGFVVSDARRSTRPVLPRTRRDSLERDACHPLLRHSLEFTS